MKAKGCDEVYLETPTNNERALSLYLSLGFVKTKFLPRYYLDHTDAVRLKLWLKPCFANDDNNNNDYKIDAQAGAALTKVHDKSESTNAADV